MWFVAGKVVNARANPVPRVLDSRGHHTHLFAFLGQTQSIRILTREYNPEHVFQSRDYPGIWLWFLDGVKWKKRSNFFRIVFSMFNKVSRHLKYFFLDNRNLVTVRTITLMTITMTVTINFSLFVFFHCLYYEINNRNCLTGFDPTLYMFFRSVPSTYT